LGLTLGHDQARDLAKQSLTVGSRLLSLLSEDILKFRRSGGIGLHCKLTCRIQLMPECICLGFLCIDVLQKILKQTLKVATKGAVGRVQLPTVSADKK
jgi:hypothetical protein